MDKSYEELNKSLHKSTDAYKPWSNWTRDPTFMIHSSTYKVNSTVASVKNGMSCMTMNGRGTTLLHGTKYCG